MQIEDSGDWATFRWLNEPDIKACCSAAEMCPTDMDASFRDMRNRDQLAILYRNSSDVSKQGQDKGSRYRYDLRSRGMRAVSCLFPASPGGFVGRGAFAGALSTAT